jgi:charged multivesicular body protein 1
MSGLEKALFNLKVRVPPKRKYTQKLTLRKFTAKQLNRQAAKAGKDEQAERAKLKKVRLHSSHPKIPCWLSS